MLLRPVYLQVFDADGEPERANVRVDEDAASVERLLSGAATPDGGCLIVTNHSPVSGVVRAYADGG